MGRSGVRRICVVTGNRSEYSKLKTPMEEIQKRNDLDLTLIVTASHLLDDYGKTVEVIKRDGFKISSIARTVAAGQDLESMVKSVGIGCLELPTLFDIYNPDIILIAADRFDILPAAISAAMMNIPVAHIQGGEVTGSIDESVRHAVTKLSHLHFPATKKSAERIIKMGEPPETVFPVGCPAVDIILRIKEKIKNMPREEICLKYGMDPDEPFLIVVQHPVTTEYNSVREQMHETLQALYKLQIQTVYLWPNVDAGSKDMVREVRLFTMKHKMKRMMKYKHIVFEDFLSLLAHCACIVGNSSSGIREACYFGTPAVNIGTRQDGRERGSNVIDVDYDRYQIEKAILRALDIGRFKPEYIYGRGDAGKKIAEILANYEFKTVQKRLTY